MNNKLKLGLSALAGSLVAFSVNSAEVTVSGGASISYDEPCKAGGAAGCKTVRGNPYYMGDSINFNIAGDMDNGIGVSVNYEIDGGALDDHSIALSADWGTLTFAGHGGNGAFSAIDDKTPNAYEEAWAVIDDNGTTTGGGATVINGYSGNGIFKYDSPDMNGATLSVGYIPGRDGHESVIDAAVAYTGMEGLTLGLGVSDGGPGGSDISETTMYATYAYGPITVGYQMSDLDSTVANSDQEAEILGVSYAVTDDISVSYNTMTVESEVTTDQDQESTGISASVTSGGFTLAGSVNDTDNNNFTGADDVEGYEFTLSFAF